MYAIRSYYAGRRRDVVAQVFERERQDLTQGLFVVYQENGLFVHRRIP